MEIKTITECSNIDFDKRLKNDVKNGWQPQFASYNVSKSSAGRLFSIILIK